MTCSELLEALVDYLNEELVIERRQTLEIHIRSCPRCELYVASYTYTVKVTRALPKCTALPPDVEARLRKVIEPELFAND